MVSVEDILKDIRRLQETAYQRGWNDAVNSIMAAAQRGMSGVIKLGPETPLQHDGSEAAEPDETAKPTIEVIHDVIKEQPGLRGADVFRETVKRIPGSNFKRIDRTGRTALKRLKEREAIYQRDKRWYPAAAKNVVLSVLEQATSDPQHGEETGTNE